MNISKQKQKGVTIVKFLILLPLITGIGLSGCALTTSRVPLHYGPPSKVSVLTMAKNVVVSVHVQDLRKHKKVGNKKNGFGMVMAAIYTKKNVAGTVRNAIEEGLQARGFRVGRNAVVFVNVGITKFYNTFNMGLITGSAVAKLDMTVIVKNKSGKQLFYRKILAKGENDSIFIASGGNAGVALDRALRNGVNMLFNNNKFTAALLH